MSLTDALSKHEKVKTFFEINFLKTELSYLEQNVCLNWTASSLNHRHNIVFQKQFNLTKIKYIFEIKVSEMAFLLYLPPIKM